MTGQLPVFSLQASPPEEIITKTNESGSVVFLMIETKDSVENVEEIAAVEGVDVLLIGSNDLAIELGVPGQFKSTQFRSALEAVSNACKKFGKVFGLAGIYNNDELQDWALNTLGAKFILGQQDSGILARSSKEVAEQLERIARNPAGSKN